MDGDSFATGVRAVSLVNGWIKTLARRADNETSAALVGLADDPALTKWSAKLRRARDEQRRAITRRTPTVNEVCEALRGGPPGSAADLVALVAERLSQLGKRVRNGSTDAWIQYWHTDPEDPKGRGVIAPKPENACRKVLVSDLEPLLDLYDVTTSQDEQVAEEKHPDIMVHCFPHAVPIEIKKTDAGISGPLQATSCMGDTVATPDPTATASTWCCGLAPTTSRIRHRAVAVQNLLANFGIG